MISRSARLLSGSVRYLEAGSGQTLILLHAFPLSAEQWLPQLARVPPGWRFVAPDLPGFGLSDPGVPAPDDARMRQYADDMLQLMMHIEAPRAVIGGLSMGGYIALAMARARPERLSGLVLADTRAAADSDETRANRDRLIGVLDRDGPLGVATDLLPKLLGETTHREQPDLGDAVRRMIEGNTPDGIRAAILAMKHREDATPVLQTLACPALIVCGAEDVVTPPSESERMQQQRPGSVLRMLPHAGHLSNLENAPAFNEALADWLPSVAAAERARGGNS
jgi:pimeloyl-ACP methyl ester carboxylesterase